MYNISVRHLRQKQIACHQYWADFGCVVTRCMVPVDGSIGPLAPQALCPCSYEADIPDMGGVWGSTLISDIIQICHAHTFQQIGILKFPFIAIVSTVQVVCKSVVPICSRLKLELASGSYHTASALEILRLCHKKDSHKASLRVEQ